VTEKLLLTITDATKLLGVSDEAVRAAVDSGQLRTVVLLKRRLIPRAAIEELVDGRADG
jgi:excisionase family DNA binding protein